MAVADALNDFSCICFPPQNGCWAVEQEMDAKHDIIYIILRENKLTSFYNI